MTSSSSNMVTNNDENNHLNYQANKVIDSTRKIQLKESTNMQKVELIADQTTTDIQMSSKSAATFI